MHQLAYWLRQVVVSASKGQGTMKVVPLSGMLPEALPIFIESSS